MCFVFYVSKNAGELAENSILFLMFTYFKSQLINKFISSHSLSYFDRFRDRIIMKSCVKYFLSDIYSTTKEAHQSLLGAIMEIRIKK